MIKIYVRTECFVILPTMSRSDNAIEMIIQEYFIYILNMHVDTGYFKL